jgi:hypothetical protein
VQRGLLAAEAFAHSSDTVLNGKTPTAGSEVILTTQASASWLDVSPFVGFWQSGKARVTTTDEYVKVLDIQDPYTQVVGVQFRNTDSAFNSDAICTCLDHNQSWYDSCLVIGDGDGSVCFDIEASGGGDNLRVKNSIAIGNHASASRGYSMFYDCYALNCLAVVPDAITNSGGTGFVADSGSPTVKNCASFGYATDFSASGFDANSDYNASDGTNGPGTNAVDSLTFASQFVNDDTDFTLVSTSGLIGVGDVDTTESRQDLLGSWRAINCDIGMEEFQPASTSIRNRTTEWTSSATTTSVSQSHTVDSDGSDYLKLSIFLKADITVSVTPTWNTSETFTLVDQTTSSGNGADMHVYTYGLVDPTATTANIAYTVDSVNHVAHLATNYDVHHTAAAVADISTLISEDVNDTATNTTVFASGGTAGETVYGAACFKGGDGMPMTTSDTAFKILANGQTGTNGTNDLAFFVVDHIGGAADAFTGTWAVTDENAGHYLNIIDGAAGSAGNAPTGNIRGALGGPLAGAI